MPSSESGWVHDDGTTCAEYLAPPESMPPTGYWCTLHEMYVTHPKAAPRQAARNLPARYADVAMYEAEPLSDGEPVRPRVEVVTMTADPLRVAAAVNGIYSGHIWLPSDITKDMALAFAADCLNSKIAAPLEWIQVGLLISGVSRAFTHQLVRQRTATFAQESLRFAVKPNAGTEVVLPPSLEGTDGGEPLGAESSREEWQRNVWDQAVQHIGEAYLHLVDSGIPAEDARGLLPTNIATRVHYRTNLRDLIEHAGLRLCSQAQHEWKLVWLEIIKAIGSYGPEADHWQQREITRLFRPVCYRTGKCEFMGAADRYCVIRDRVEAHHAKGEPPAVWVDIEPHEPLHRLAAVDPRH